MYIYVYMYVYVYVHVHVYLYVYIDVYVYVYVYVHVYLYVYIDEYVYIYMYMYLWFLQSFGHASIECESVRLMTIGLTRILLSIIDTTDQKEKIFYQWIDTFVGLHDR